MKRTAQYGEQARQQFPTYYGRLVVLGKAVPARADTASLMVQLSAIAHRTDVQFRGISLGAGSGDATATAAATPRRHGTRHSPASATVTSGTSTASVTARARRYRGSTG